MNCGLINLWKSWRFDKDCFVCQPDCCLPLSVHSWLIKSVNNYPTLSHDCRYIPFDDYCLFESIDRFFIPSDDECSIEYLNSYFVSLGKYHSINFSNSWSIPFDSHYPTESPNNFPIQIKCKNYYLRFLTDLHSINSELLRMIQSCELQPLWFVIQIDRSQTAIRRLHEKDIRLQCQEVFLFETNTRDGRVHW